MGKYAVTYNSEAHNITMELSGYFTDNDAARFVDDFLKMSRSINVHDTYLILDCGKLHLYPRDVKIALKDIFKLYKETGYKLVRMKLFKPQKELARKLYELAEDVGLTLENMFME